MPDDVVRVETPAIPGRSLVVRPGTRDYDVLADTFTGLYHLPPVELSPATVLDLGANIGLVAAHYRLMWPNARIVAVEMDKEASRLIHRNAPGVAVWNHAVAGSAGIGHYNPGLPSDAYRFEPGNGSGVAVSALTMTQTIVRAFGPSQRPVDFVKMDVEGSEWGILADPEWMPLARHLLVELHPEGAPDAPAVLEGRDGPSALVTAAAALLEAGGMRAVPHTRHPHAVWATWS